MLSSSGTGTSPAAQNAGPMARSTTFDDFGGSHACGLDPVPVEVVAEVEPSLAPDGFALPASPRTEQPADKSAPRKRQARGRMQGQSATRAPAWKGAPSAAS